MLYRKIGRTQQDVGVIGLGCEWLHGLSAAEVTKMFDLAMSAGINMLDLFMPQPDVRSNIGQALRGRREKMMIQGHLCTVFENDQYTRTRDLAKTKASFEDLLKRLETDYIDVGMIHYVDTPEDFESVFNTPIIEYAKELKARGVIKALGLSSHSPEIALRAVETGLIDVLMFSINPAYDLEKSDTEVYSLIDFKGFDEHAWTVDPARQQLYAVCESRGVGITVMKALGAGSLLDAERSPFGKALTVPQCCHYCLTRPGVVSVLVGCQNESELKTALAYMDASAEERDYSQVISGNPKFQMDGRCMYCNHCQPCPVRIDIAAVTKYLDLARMHDEVPETVKAHYLGLKYTAKDCIQCGRCEPNCPFGVKVRENMQKAYEIFGR